VGAENPVTAFDQRLRHQRTLRSQRGRSVPRRHPWHRSKRSRRADPGADGDLADGERHSHTRSLVGSSLTAVDLAELTRVELGFTLVLGAAAGGLVLFLGLAERRRSFAILTALGATGRQLRGLVACHCPSVNLRASPAAVVELNPATGANACPARSARWRSNPIRKSSPASCAAAIPTSNSPPVNPRSRTLIGPIAASNSLIMSRRSTNSVTATIPESRVNDGSGAPSRTRRRNRAISRTLPTR
jgi:hypothetical protein